jgi:hypothetical protein
MASFLFFIVGLVCHILSDQAATKFEIARETIKLSRLRRTDCAAMKSQDGSSLSGSTARRLLLFRPREKNNGAAR